MKLTQNKTDRETDPKLTQDEVDPTQPKTDWNKILPLSELKTDPELIFNSKTDLTRPNLWPKKLTQLYPKTDPKIKVY